MPKDRYKIVPECEGLNIPSVYREGWATPITSMAKKFKGRTGKIVVCELRIDGSYKESFSLDVHEDGSTNITHKH